MKLLSLLALFATSSSLYVLAFEANGELRKEIIYATSAFETPTEETSRDFQTQSFFDVGFGTCFT